MTGQILKSIGQTHSCFIVYLALDLGKRKKKSVSFTFVLFKNVLGLFDFGDSFASLFTFVNHPLKMRFMKPNKKVHQISSLICSDYIFSNKILYTQFEYLQFTKILFQEMSMAAEHTPVKK